MWPKVKIRLPSKLLKDHEIHGYKLAQEACAQLTQQLPGTKVFIGDDRAAANLIGVVSHVDGYDIVIEAARNIPDGCVSNIDFAAERNGTSIDRIVKIASVGISTRQLVGWTD